MADLARELRAAARHVVTDLSAQELERMELRVHARLARERRVRIALGASLVAAACALAFVAPWSTSVPARAPVAMTRVAPPQVTAVEISDGRALVTQGAVGKVALNAGSPSLAAVSLLAGEARFVVRRSEGRFRLEAGCALVTASDAELTVALLAGGTRVAVRQGRVKVVVAAESAVLSAGEARTFTRALVEADEGVADERAEDADADADEPPAESAHARPSRSKWRALAEQGDFARAYRALQVEGSAAVRDEPGELLLSADTARLSGHAEQAVAPLERVLRKHARDPRAPLAAFTLGRVQLEELGRPHEAAAAFARARALQPKAPLAQDALAREVEARSRLGQNERARQLAEEYVRLYPSGTKLRSVRRYGGLD